MGRLFENGMLVDLGLWNHCRHYDQRHREGSVPDHVVDKTGRMHVLQPERCYYKKRLAR